MGHLITVGYPSRRSRSSIANRARDRHDWSLYFGIGAIAKTIDRQTLDERSIAVFYTSDRSRQPNRKPLQSCWRSASDRGMIDRTIAERSIANIMMIVIERSRRLFSTWIPWLTATINAHAKFRRAQIRCRILSSLPPIYPRGRPNNWFIWFRVNVNLVSLERRDTQQRSVVCMYNGMTVGTSCQRSRYFNLAFLLFLSASNMVDLSVANLAFLLRGQ